MLKRPGAVGNINDLVNSGKEEAVGLFQTLSELDFELNKEEDAHYVLMVTDPTG
jgi:hypothetical protein